MIQHRWKCPRCLSEVRSDEPIGIMTSRRSVKHNIIADYLYANGKCSGEIIKVVENYILCQSCGGRHWLLDDSINEYGGNVIMRYLDNDYSDEKCEELGIVIE